MVALRGFFGERSELSTDGCESQRLRVLRDACGLKVRAVTACTLPEKSWSSSSMVGRGRSKADKLPISRASPTMCRN